MAKWLVKSEPEVWSLERQEMDGTTFWDGVRNHQAANHLKAMRKGDQVLFYHSGDERQVVGVVEVAREYYPDHTDETGKFGMVDLKFVRKLPRPVTLAAVKADPALAKMQLVTHSRLSVQAVDEAAWARIMTLAGAA